MSEKLIGFEADDVAEEAESLFHRSDGRWILPLSERVVAAVGFSGGPGTGVFFLSENLCACICGALPEKNGSRWGCVG